MALKLENYRPEAPKKGGGEGEGSGGVGRGFSRGTTLTLAHARETASAWSVIVEGNKTCLG